jgi:hypothetical protein
MKGETNMVSSDDKRNLCRDSYTVARLIEQTIFNQITPETTFEQFAAAQDSLKRLCERFEANLDLFHYPAIRGTAHQCVRDVYEEARARLENLAIMQPPPPSLKPQQRITREGIVSDHEGKIQTSTEETDVGTEDSPFADWDGS